MLEVCLRSYCCRSVFDICMVHLLSSWCLNMVGSWGLMGFLVISMVCGDVSSWYVEMVFFMVCGDGCILRTHKVLGKGVIYAFIWHVILGARMVLLLYHDILFICVLSFDMLYYVHMEHVISLVEMGRSCFHVYVLRPWLELWQWSWFSLFELSELIICWILHDISMFHLELTWIDWLHVLMH